MRYGDGLDFSTRMLHGARLVVGFSVDVLAVLLTAIGVVATVGAIELVAWRSRPKHKLEQRAGDSS